jgi:hypothetical protein
MNAATHRRRGMNRLWPLITAGFSWLLIAMAEGD